MHLVLWKFVLVYSVAELWPNYGRHRRFSLAAADESYGETDHQDRQKSEIVLHGYLAGIKDEDSGHSAERHMIGSSLASVYR